MSCSFWYFASPMFRINEKTRKIRKQFWAFGRTFKSLSSNDRSHLKCRQISQNMHTSRDLIICKLKIRRDWYTHYFSEKAWCMQAANYGKHMLRLWYSFISLSNSYMIRCQDLNTVESWSSHRCYCYSILMIRSKIKQKT